MDKIKLAQRTIALLSSMIESGECHTTRTKEMKDNAINGLDQLSIDDVSKRFWYFDCWDKTGQTMSLQIEALNAENAEIIFKYRYQDYGYDSPY